MGDFALGVGVGPGARLPRLPALNKAKAKMEIDGSRKSRGILGRRTRFGDSLGSNFPTVSELAEKVEDQVRRGQVIKHTEKEARVLYPCLVIASLGANRKEKSDETLTARALHDGSNGVPVNRRTRVRDQESLKRGMREKARRGEKTFALTADVKVAHRQIPVVRQDWKLLFATKRLHNITLFFFELISTLHT